MIELSTAFIYRKESSSGGYGALTEKDMIEINPLRKEKPVPEPIPIPDTRSKEEREFAYRVEYNPEIQQAKAYLGWIGPKHQEKLHEEKKEKGY